MSNLKLWVATSGVVLIVVSLSMAPTLTQSHGSGSVSGTIRANGTPLEGVTVSVRASHETWTTSVFTDADGSYRFDALTPGQYAMWAQSKGFDIARAEFTLPSGERVSRDLSMQPLNDPMKVARQADGPEWFAALPEENTQDRRMKHLLRNNCTACHGPAYTLAPRFDQRGWENIIDIMARGVPPSRGPGEGNPVWQAYKEELAEYLGRVSKDLRPKTKNPTGAETQVVITEYDIPRQGRPISAHTGTFWTEGQSTRWESKGARDIWVDSKGNLWVSDDRSIGRTTGKLDPKTGKWADYALPNSRGVATNSHGVWGDLRTDMIFQGGQPDGAILAFDTNKEEFVHFARADSIPGGGGHIDVDSQGNAWAPAQEGALKLNPKTGEYTYYPVPYLEGSRPQDRNQYGLAVDAQDNVWIARAGTESVAWLNPRTGETGHVKFEPMEFHGLTEKDRTVAVGMNIGPPNGKGPRRLGSGGRNGGNFMWVALNKSDAVAKIDIRTKQVVKEYPLPPGSAPYFATVDKNGMVWIPPQNADRVFKLDPNTERITQYYLPTRGTDLRHLTVDDRTTPPTVWVTYNRSNKIARVQERPVGTAQAAR